MNSVMLNNLGLKHQWLQRYRSEILVCYKDSITFRYNLKNNCNCAKKVLRERSTGPTKRGRTDNEEVKIMVSHLVPINELSFCHKLKSSYPHIFAT